MNESDITHRRHFSFEGRFSEEKRLNKANAPS